MHWSFTGCKKSGWLEVKEALAKKGTGANTPCITHLFVVSHRIITSYVSFLSFSPLCIFHFFFLTCNATVHFSLIVVTLRRRRKGSRIIPTMAFWSVCKMVQIPWVSSKCCWEKELIWALLAVFVVPPGEQVPEICSLCNLHRGALLTAHAEC